MDILDDSSLSDGANLNISDFLRELPGIPDLTQEADPALPEDLQDVVIEPPGAEEEDAPEPPSAPLQSAQQSEAQHSSFNAHVPSPEAVCAALASSFQGASFSRDQMIPSSLMAASRRPTLSSAICSLQCRLSRLQGHLPEVHSLRAFYSEKSQNIEMIREQCLDIADSHRVQGVNAHYDETHFRLIDRILQRLVLIEQQKYYAQHPSAFPTPPPQPFVPQVPPQPVVQCPPQPLHQEESSVQCPPQHQEAPHPVQTSTLPLPNSRLSDDSGHFSTASSASGSAESSPEPPAHKLPTPSKLLLYTKKNVIKPLNKQATQLFEKWYDQNFEHPYPTSAEAKYLASMGGVTLDQTRKWFANKRRRDNNTRSMAQLAEVKKLQKIVSQVYPQYQ